MSRTIAAILALLLLGGCATANQACHSAIDEYQAERYDVALADFKKITSQQADMNARWRLRYLVFRGLAHFHVWQEKGRRDDLLEARRFLDKAKSLYENSNRDYLTVAEERDLDQALDEATAAETKEAKEPAVAEPTSAKKARAGRAGAR